METNNLAETISKWILGLELRIKQMEEQLASMQCANNELADIAFDENRFTQQLLEKVDDTAREAVKESLDYDEIAREMTQYIDDMVDMDSLAERVVNNIDTARLAREVADTNTFSDKIDDTVERVLSDSNILNADEVDEAVGDYLHNNDYAERGDVEDIVRDMLSEMPDEIAKQVIETIANRLRQTLTSTPSTAPAIGVDLQQTSLQEGGSH